MGKAYLYGPLEAPSDPVDGVTVSANCYHVNRCDIAYIRSYKVFKKDVPNKNKMPKEIYYAWDDFDDAYSYFQELGVTIKPVMFRKLYRNLFPTLGLIAARHLLTTYEHVVIKGMNLYIHSGDNHHHPLKEEAKEWLVLQEAGLITLPPVMVRSILKRINS